MRKAQPRVESAFDKEQQEKAKRDEFFSWRVGGHERRLYLRPPMKNLDALAITRAAYGDPSPDFIAEMARDNEIK